MKLYSGEYSIVDLLAVSRSKASRVAATPFGKGVAMHRYAGRSVPWKHVKTTAAMSAMGGGAARVAAVIEGRLLPGTRGHRERGVVLASIRGRTILLSRKAFEVAKRHGVPSAILAEAGSAAEILEAYAPAAIVA
jgi:hypothetical protein